MNLITIDTDRCVGDGLCVAVCPVGIIDFQGESPEPVSGAADLCINCGHCVAVCPEGALSHRKMTPDDCPSVLTDGLPTLEQIEKVLCFRRSIRCYKESPVEREKLTKLIEAVRFAPSGHNSQPLEWHIIYERKDVQALAGVVMDWMLNLIDKKPKMANQMQLDRIKEAWDAGTDRICRKAPHVIVTHAPKQDSTAQAASTIALGYLELAAPSFGLGTCWSGYFNMAATSWPPMKEALGLPEGRKYYGAMLIGYPKYVYQRVPLRKDPKITWR